MCATTVNGKKTIMGRISNGPTRPLPIAVSTANMLIEMAKQTAMPTNDRDESARGTKQIADTAKIEMAIAMTLSTTASSFVEPCCQLFWKSATGRLLPVASTAECPQWVETGLSLSIENWSKDLRTLATRRPGLDPGSRFFWARVIGTRGLSICRIWTLPLLAYPKQEGAGPRVKPGVTGA